jgi:hypothetical protein
VGPVSSAGEDLLTTAGTDLLASTARSTVPTISRAALINGTVNAAGSTAIGAWQGHIDPTYVAASFVGGTVATTAFPTEGLGFTLQSAKVAASQGVADGLATGTVDQIGEHGVTPNPTHVMMNTAETSPGDTVGFAGMEGVLKPGAQVAKSAVSSSSVALRPGVQP